MRNKEINNKLSIKLILKIIQNNNFTILNSQLRQIMDKESFQALF
jgi:hypothetical protein